jgi:hypothetical protein
MPVKLKPSTKEYKRDAKGKMTNQWTWKHYTPSNTSTEELLKMLSSPSERKNKNKIQKELTKREIEWENSKKK